MKHLPLSAKFLNIPALLSTNGSGHLLNRVEANNRFRFLKILEIPPE